MPRDWNKYYNDPSYKQGFDDGKADAQITSTDGADAISGSLGNLLKTAEQYRYRAEQAEQAYHNLKNRIKELEQSSDLISFVKQANNDTETRNAIDALIQSEGFQAIQQVPDLWAISDPWARNLVAQLYIVIQEVMLMHHEVDTAGQALDDLVDGFDSLVVNNTKSILIRDLVSYAGAVSGVRLLDKLKDKMTDQLQLLEGATETASHYGQIVKPEIFEKVRKRINGLQEMVQALPEDMTVVYGWKDKDWDPVMPAIESLKSAVKSDSHIKAIIHVAQNRPPRGGRTEGSLDPFTTALKKCAQPFYDKYPDQWSEIRDKLWDDLAFRRSDNPQNKNEEKVYNAWKDGARSKKERNRQIEQIKNAFR